MIEGHLSKMDERNTCITTTRSGSICADAAGRRFAGSNHNQPRNRRNASLNAGEQTEARKYAYTSSESTLAELRCFANRVAGAHTSGNVDSTNLYEYNENNKQTLTQKNRLGMQPQLRQSEADQGKPQRARD